MWGKAINSPNFLLYFPTYSEGKFPQRRYLLNVANTVIANSVVKAVMDIRAKRERQLIEDEPIIMTNEFVNLFN